MQFTEPKKMNGPMAGYRISYTDEERLKETKDVGVVTTFLLESLKKYTTYEITLSVRNTLYYGPESGAKSRRTLEDGTE